MSATWKTVRVFISSTFRDMHAERDHLVKRVFPRLRQWCQERRLRLFDIDLRWGVTKEQADNGAAIDICLKEIDGSRPFFVCILGVRYGWVPDKLPPEEIYAFQGLQAETHLSITHLEILHAAMQSIPTIEGKSEPVCKHAFFYFRDSNCLPAPKALTVLTEEERKEYEETFFEHLPQRKQMLMELKHEIRQRYTADDRVFDYAGQWDAKAANPEDELLKGRLTDLRLFGERVEVDLIRGIEDQFRGHIAALGAADDPLASERSDHDAFLENRTQVHVPRLDVEQHLHEYTDSNDNRPLVLSGPPGSGKSAILAHWVAENVDRDTWLSKSGDRTFVIPRFIGASTGSVNLHRLLGNVCQELQSHFDLEEEVAEENGDQKQSHVQKMEVPADPVQVQQKWPKFLEAAAEKGRVIIILDAINQLDRSADPMRLYWLPRELPKNIRIVVSALDHGEKSDPEYKPGEDNSLDWLSVMRRMKLPEVRVPELTDDERRHMIREIPSVFCKTLDNAQITALLNNHATSNPLFLYVALDELRVYGGFGKTGERLFQAIRRLPWLKGQDEVGANDTPPDDAPIVITIDDALDALFGQILDRLKRETDQQAFDLSPTLFRLLASARDGLSEEELSGILARVLTDVDQEARDGEMQVVLRQVRPYLVRKGVQQRLSELDHPPDDFDENAPADQITAPTQQVVLLDYYHRSFWKAVRAKYLDSEQARAQAHRELAAYCMWNSCWCYDSPEAAGHYVLPAERRALGALPWEAVGRPVSTLVEQWRGNKERSEPGFPWLRSLRPPPVHLGTAQKLVLQGHTSWVESVCFSPDGQRLASASMDKTVRVWDAFSGTEVLQLQGHSDRVTSMRFSPDGQRIASASGDDTVRVWDASSGGELLQIQGHTSRVNSVCFSPDGQRLASGSNDNVVRVWDSFSGSEVLQLLGHKASVDSVCYSPDGQRIATASFDQTVRVWDASNGATVLQIQKHKGRVTCVCFSPDGQRLASASGDKTLRVWNASSGAELLQIQGHTGRVTCVCFSPDGQRLSSGSEDRSVRAWDAFSGAELLLLQGHGDNVDSVCFSPDGLRLASASWDLTLRVWDAPGGAELLQIQEHKAHVDSVCFSPDGRRLASASWDKTVRVWDATSGAEVLLLQGHTDRVCSVCFSPDGQRLASASWDRTARVWDASNGTELLRFLGHTHVVFSVCFSPDGQRLASASSDKTVRMWDASTGVEVLQIQGHKGRVSCVQFSPDGEWLAGASSDWTVRLWNASNGVEVHELQGHKARVDSVCFSPDGQRLASLSTDNTVRVWEVSSGECLEVHEEVPVTELRAFAAGPANTRWRPFYRGFDTVLDEATMGLPVARFSAPAHCDYTSSPFGRIWGWGVDRYIYLVTLEGRPASSLAARDTQVRASKPTSEAHG